MNAITEISNIMSDTDKKAFIKLLSKRNKRKDTGNIDLFKSLETDDIKYKNNRTDKKAADAYHALRKRLYDSLIEFMGNRSFEQNTGEEHEVLRLLVASHVFFEHKLNKEAFKCLAKAEAKAQKLEHFSLLNEIYQTQIQFSHLRVEIPLGPAITKYTLNKHKLDQQEQLNLAYAVLRRELDDIYHKAKIVDLQLLIKDTMANFGISLKEVLTFKSLYQILFIANEYASINSNFNLIEPFVEKSYRFVMDKQELAERHLYYHIYILYFMANIHFRNRKFELSDEYLNRMETEMQKQGKKYYNRFSARYSLLKALNENYKGFAVKAIDTALKALANGRKTDPADVNDLRLCIVIFYIQQGDNKTAHKYMKQFIHTDSWYEKKMGMDWTIKKSLIEILLHAELENTELALSRITSFKRRYKKYLGEVKEERVMAYVFLLEKFISKPDAATGASFQKSFEDLLNTSSGSNEDIFVLSFLGWLLAKIQKKSIYSVTLELVNGYFSPFHSA